MYMIPQFNVYVFAHVIISTVIGFTGNLLNSSRVPIMHLELYEALEVVVLVVGG